MIRYVLPEDAQPRTSASRRSWNRNTGVGEFHRTLDIGGALLAKMAGDPVSGTT